MNAPAKSFGPKAGGTYSAKARARWGTVPDWIAQLALAADMAPSQGELGKRLGVDASAISGVIGKTYAGRFDYVEALVRGKLMSATVDCPVKHTISRDDCARFQKLPFSAASPERAQLFRACRAGCPNALGGKHAS